MSDDSVSASEGEPSPALQGLGGGTVFPPLSPLNSARNIGDGLLESHGGDAFVASPATKHTHHKPRGRPRLPEQRKSRTALFDEDKQDHFLSAKNESTGGQSALSELTEAEAARRERQAQYSGLAMRRQKILRISDKGPTVIRNVLEDCGWADVDSSDGGEWHLHWKSSRFKPSEYAKVGKYQKLNHFPKSTAITKKDSLYRNLRKLRAVYGPIYGFSPLTFVLPTEYTKFVTAYSHQEEKEIWICKPPDLSRGRKIFLIRDLGDLTYDCQMLVQRYVKDPLLVGGYKFDLRLYVLVTSYHPMHVYFFNNGLVRFGTQKYDTDKLDNLYAHLTNWSINKFSPTVESNKEGIGPGCKWSVSQLREYWAKRGVDDKKLFKRIKNICILTTLICAPLMPHSPSCFELFGFDIMVDSQMKPWLLEVNTSPALGTESLVDIQIKEPLIRDMVKVLDFDSLLDEQRLEMEQAERQRQSRGRQRVTMNAFCRDSTPNRRNADKSGTAHWKEAEAKAEGTNFELIFPFNEATSVAASRMILDKAGLSQTNFKTIVSEVKAMEMSWREKGEGKGKPKESPRSTAQTPQKPIDHAVIAQRREVLEKYTTEEARLRATLGTLNELSTLQRGSSVPGSLGTVAEGRSSRPDGELKRPLKGTSSISAAHARPRTERIGRSLSNLTNHNLS